MAKLTEMTKEERMELKDNAFSRYHEYSSKGLKLLMTRGIPCTEQLDLSNDMLKISDYIDNHGVDCRNYGGVDGIQECKALFADLLNVKENQIIVGGNASLNMMHDTIIRGMLVGMPGTNEPWSNQKIKFICPVPGYDRHFSICELYNIEMINVDMQDDGPDVDAIEKLVANDDSIKGMWAVPKYSNPQGISYSDEKIKRLANMKTAAKDFRLFWDNAYAFHHLDNEPVKILDILDECEKAGNPDRAFIFASTSKVSFAGSGVAVIATSVYNASVLTKQMNVATIGPDKLNQLRHAKFFKNSQGLIGHMKKHAAILKPKFNKVCEVLDKNLGGLDIAKWRNPKGGYFINLETMPGCADRIVKLAADAGVVLTSPAGSAFPYKKDPNDSNIRIAPTFPSVEELDTAMNIVSCCVLIASIEKML